MTSAAAQKSIQSYLRGSGGAPFSNLAAACALTQSTIDAAETEIDQLHRDEDAYEASRRVLQLLRDNLATWTRALPVGVALGLVLHRYDSNRS